LPARLVGPLPEQGSRHQLRWWVELPGAAERVLVGLDSSAIGERRQLSLKEEQPPQRISGILMTASDKILPLPWLVTGEGQIRMRLLRS
jgi:hypothetical protein